MRRIAMNTFTVLLLCLAATYVVQGQYFPKETAIYKYNACVKVGNAGPSEYVSQFALAGELHIKKDDSDSMFDNAYYIKLQNVEHNMYNGVMQSCNSTRLIHELDQDARQIEDPFLVVYDQIGKVQGIKISDTENIWSRNIKQGIASMLQLDSRISFRTPMKSHDFATVENTLYGACEITYDSYELRENSSTNSTVFAVTRIYDLNNCSHFKENSHLQRVQRVFDHAECEKCHVESTNDEPTIVRSTFYIEQQDNIKLLKRLETNSQFNISYFPNNAHSEVHYLSSQTVLSLDRIVPTKESHLPVVNFQNIPFVRDVIFNKSWENYAPDAAKDLTHGRHTVKLKLVLLKAMLTRAVDYIEKDEIEIDQDLDWEQGQTINRLQHVMSYMDLDSLNQVYDFIQIARTPREITMRTIFLEMIPTVGTTAACYFTRKVISERTVSNATACRMLMKLPMYVKEPTVQLLSEMEELLKLGDTISPQVRKTAILCFSTLIRKTYMNAWSNFDDSRLDRYLRLFFDHVRNDRAYDMKLLYLMALKNVQVGGVERFLEPIIRGDVSISEHPHIIRAHAIWAIKKSDKIEYTYNLLWPIVTNASEPRIIRITAYDVLMSQSPNIQKMMNIHSFMVHEKDKDVHHYYDTTIKGLANSVDPCLASIREAASKISSYTNSDVLIDGELSFKQYSDYTDPMYGHGESWSLAWIRNDADVPQAGYVGYHVLAPRKRVEKVGIYWNVRGMREIKKLFRTMFENTGNLQNVNVQKVLDHVAQSMPPNEEIHVDFFVTLNSHVIAANHYDRSTIQNLPAELFRIHQSTMNNFQSIDYDTFYEMQVPTDMGLQAVFSTKMPLLLSHRWNIVAKYEPFMNLTIQFDNRLWRHGEHAVSVYNPIADVWHSVRRSTAQNVILPIDIRLEYNYETKNARIVLPRFPITEFSCTRVRNYAKSLVIVTGDEHRALETSCPACQHRVVIKVGDKKDYFIVYTDSRDLGLTYSMKIFSCDSNITPMSYVQEWQRALSSEHKNTWNSTFMQYYMGIRQKLANDYISPEIGSCGISMEIVPSVVYFTQHIELNIKPVMEDTDYLHEKMHYLSGKLINVHGSLNAIKRYTTNDPLCSWDVNATIEISQKHIMNSLKLQVTRATPREKKLKFCLDGQETYSNPDEGNNNELSTNMKMTISAGYTDEDECADDLMLFTITAKGEMTEEQKDQTIPREHGSCARDARYHRSWTNESYSLKTPKSLGCIREAMFFTIMRKYTIDVSCKRMPVYVFAQLALIDKYISAMNLGNMRYIENRTSSNELKSVIEFPLYLNYINVSVVTPVDGYEYVKIPVLPEDAQPQELPPYAGWHIFLDNTNFTIDTTSAVVQGNLKICTVYSKGLITFDDDVIPFTMSNQWILVSGDYIDQTCAIFAKSIQDDMIAVRVYISNHKIEIMPSKFNTSVTVDDNVVEYERGVMVPENHPYSYKFKITENDEHLIVQSLSVPITILWAPKSMSVVTDVTLQRSMTGECQMKDIDRSKMIEIFLVRDL